MFSSIRRAFCRQANAIHAPMSTSSEASKVLSAPALAGFEAVSQLSDVLAADKGLTSATIPSNGTPLVLVSQGGKISALYGRCPHKDADMALGDIEDSNTAQGICVKCPRHRKKFNGGLNFRVEDGASWVHEPCEGKYDPSWNLPIFDVRTESGFVYVSSNPVKGTIPAAKADDDGGSDSKDAKKRKDKKDKAAKETTDESALAIAASALKLDRKDDITAPSWTEAQLQEVVPHTADTVIYRLKALARPVGADLPLLHSWHVSVMLDQPHLPTMSREYTPITTLPEWTTGSFVMDLLVKHYAHGNFTNRLRKLAPGDRLKVSAPEPTLRIPSLLPPSSSPTASTTLAYERDSEAAGAGVTHVLLIAGGTGITPMLQVMRWAVAMPSYHVTLVCSNHSATDILLEDVITGMAHEHADKLRVLHTFTRHVGHAATERSTGPNIIFSDGRISKDILKLIDPAPAIFDRVIVSGPKGMFGSVCEALAGAELVHPTKHDSVVVELEA